MDLLDILIFIIYFGAMLGIGFYFLKKNKTIDDYYIGGRLLGRWHGISVVATDVGDGSSIGLGCCSTVILTVAINTLSLNLDANAFGISASGIS